MAAQNLASSTQATVATTFAATHATFQVATGTSSDTVGRASDARYVTGATGATGAICSFVTHVGIKTISNVDVAYFHDKGYNRFF